MKNVKTADIARINTRTVHIGRFSPGKLKTAIIVTGITTLSLISTGAFSQKTADAIKSSKSATEIKSDTLGFVAGERDYLKIGDYIGFWVGQAWRIELGDLSIATGKDNIHTAILNLFDDKNDRPRKKMQIAPGEAITITLNGATITIVCYETFPGYTLNEKSADLQIFYKR
ncbi:MAG: hypothetical protein WC861_05290 [Candidatus Micrarchaeia archaeon]|jgi:hypothetical protein